MAKSLPASNKVMKNYLSELLTESPEQDKTAKVDYQPTVETEKLEKLLNQVSVTDDITTDVITTNKSERSFKASPVVEKVTAKQKIANELISKEIMPAVETKVIKSTEQAIAKSTHRLQEEESFQAMFFDVAGLTVAVPLVELGGIHNATETTKLMGKPDWFRGVMINREQKINVVDTARWVMPEKCNEVLINSLNYQYIIMLSDSQWGLSAENLIDTVVLKAEDVKWLESTNKRPWLAGLVKERMCALLDVKSMINLLNEGENIYRK